MAELMWFALNGLSGSAAATHVLDQIRPTRSAENAPGILREDQTGPDLATNPWREYFSVISTKSQAELEPLKVQTRGALARFREAHEGNVFQDILDRMENHTVDPQSGNWLRSRLQPTGPLMAVHHKRPQTVVFVNPDLDFIARYCHWEGIPVESFFVHALKRIINMDRSGLWCTNFQLSARDRPEKNETHMIQLSYVQASDDIGLVLISDLPCPPADTQTSSDACFEVVAYGILESLEPGAARKVQCDGDTVVELHWPGETRSRAALASAIAELAESLLHNHPALRQRGLKELLNPGNGRLLNGPHHILYHLLASWQSVLSLRSAELDAQQLAYRVVTAAGAETLTQLASVRQRVVQVQRWLDHTTSLSVSASWSLQRFDRAVLARRSQCTALSKVDDVDNISTFSEGWKFIQESINRITKSLNESNDLLIGTITVRDSEIMKKQSERTTMLTILAVIYLPVTLVTGIFGMNITEITKTEDAPRWYTVLIGLITAAFTTALIFIAIYFFMRDRRKREHDKKQQIEVKMQVLWAKAVKKLQVSSMKTKNWVESLFKKPRQRWKERWADKLP